MTDNDIRIRITTDLNDDLWLHAWLPWRKGEVMEVFAAREVGDIHESRKVALDTFALMLVEDMRERDNMEARQ